jgi:hypothetical protein
MTNIECRLIRVVTDDIALLPKPILVWGFGYFAREIFQLIPRACRHIDYIFDKNPQGGRFQSIEITKPYPLKNAPRTIIVGSSVCCEEIKRQAQDQFVSPINFYSIRTQEIHGEISPFVLSTLPRSGTHWLKKMIMDMGFCSFERIEAQRSVDEFHQDFREMFPCLLGGEFYCEHLIYKNVLPVINRLRPKVILLHRDPRDRLISTFFYRFKDKGKPHIDNTEINVTMKAFLKSEICLLPDRYETHFFDWMDYGNLICIKYEELLADTEKALLKIINFLHLCTDINLKDIIEKNSFKKLANGRDAGEEDVSNHYRKGIVGDWETYFDSEISAMYSAKMKHIHERLGYDL